MKIRNEHTPFVPDLRELNFQICFWFLSHLLSNYIAYPMRFVLDFGLKRFYLVQEPIYFHDRSDGVSGKISSH